MNNRNSFFVFELRERRARESNPQRLAPHLISSYEKSSVWLSSVLQLSVFAGFTRSRSRRNSRSMHGFINSFINSLATPAASAPWASVTRQ